MADVGEIMGMVMAGLARARQIADQESVAIAREYQKDPLLQGVTIPRIRVPTMTVDIPVLIEEQEAAQGLALKDKEALVDAVHREVTSSAKKAGLALKAGVAATIRRDLQAGVSKVDHELTDSALAGAHVAKMVEGVLSRHLSGVGATSRGEASKLKLVLDSVRKKAEESTVVESPRTARLKATVLTQEIKERSSPENVTRISITLKEEGLEWSSYTKEDGSTEHRLTPE